MIVMHTVEEFWEYVTHCGHSQWNDRELGIIAAMLELETRARIFEEFGGTLLIESSNLSVASALRDVQRSLGTSLNRTVDIHDEYDRLAQFVQDSVPKRIIVHDDGSESVLWPAASSPPASPPSIDPPASSLFGTSQEDKNQAAEGPFVAIPQATSPAAELYSEEHRRRWRKDADQESGLGDEDIEREG